MSEMDGAEMDRLKAVIEEQKIEIAQLREHVRKLSIENVKLLESQPKIQLRKYKEVRDGSTV